MLFITLAKFRRKLTMDDVERMDMLYTSRTDVNVIGCYWALRRYDRLCIYEAESERTVVELLVQLGDIMSSETLVGVETLTTALLAQEA